MSRKLGQAILIAGLFGLSACESIGEIVQVAQMAANGASNVAGNWIDQTGKTYTVTQNDLELQIKDDATGRTYSGSVALFGVISRWKERGGGGTDSQAGQVSPDAKVIDWDGDDIWYRAPTDFAGVDRNVARNAKKFRSINLDAIEPAVCRNACAADADCYSFTLQPPNVSKSGKPQCDLNLEEGDSYSSAGRFSGVIQSRIDASRTVRPAKYFVRLDQIDCLDTNESGEDEIYIKASIDGLGFYRYGEVHSINEDSDIRYWYPDMQWEFSSQLVVQLWEDDEMLGQSTFYSNYPDSNDYGAIFGDLEEARAQDVFSRIDSPLDGVYQLSFTKGSIYPGNAEKTYTRVIENVQTLKPASGVDRDTMRTVTEVLDIGGYIMELVGQVDKTEVSELVGLAIDTASWVNDFVGIIDEYLGSPDQLQVQLDGKKIWPEGAAFKESDVGDIHRVYSIQYDAKSATLELFDVDTVSDPDSLGELYMSAKSAPALNDPNVRMVMGDANEGSVYSVTTRVYEDASATFCRLYDLREVALMAHGGFLHAKEDGGANVQPTAGAGAAQSLWKVACTDGGAVRFEPTSGRGKALGAAFGKTNWIPMRLSGTDIWAFRNSPTVDKGDIFLAAVSRDARLQSRLDQWARFTIKTHSLTNPDFPANKPFRMMRSLKLWTDRYEQEPDIREACLTAAPPIAKGAMVGVTDPCTEKDPSWRLEPSPDKSHEFAYRLRYLGAETPLYVTNDPDKETLTLSECAGSSAECLWYIDWAWNLPGEGEFYLRSASDGEFRGMATKIAAVRKQDGRDASLLDPSKAAKKTWDPDLLGAPAITDNCLREANNPDCQWRVDFGIR